MDEATDEIDFLTWKIRVRDKLDKLKALSEELKAPQEDQNGGHDAKRKS